MPRLLQLLPPSCSDEALALADLLAGALPEGDVIRTRVRRPLWALIRLLNQDYAAAVAIHAIGRSVRACLAARVPVIYTPDVTARKGDLRALRLLSSRVPTLAITASEHARAALEPFAGAHRPLSQVHLVPPPVKTSGPSVRDPMLRERLGLAPTDRVVLAVGPSTRAADHTTALWTVGMLALLDPSWRLLFMGEGPLVHTLRRFSADLRSDRTVVFASDRIDRAFDFSELLPAADYALCTDLIPTDSMPLRATLAAGLPLLCTRTPLTAELVPPELHVRPSTPRFIARRLLDFTEVPAVLQANLASLNPASSRVRAPLPPGVLERVLSSMS